jgi:hypothetical protein
MLFDIAAQRAPGGFIGQLLIQELDGRFTQRAVEGKTCDGVVNALAFVAAVLVDPEAVQLPEPAAPEPPAPKPPPPATLPWPPPISMTRKPVVLGIAVTSGVASATAPSLQLTFGVRLTAAFAASHFSPWFSLGLDERTAVTQSTPLDSSTSAVTSFGGWLATVAFSPIRWPGAGKYFLRPLALFEIGQLTADSSAPGNPTFKAHNQGLLWLAPGLGAIAEAQILRPLSLFLDLNASVPLSHRSYLISTPADAPVTTTPYVGFTARIGIAVNFI